MAGLMSSAHCPKMVEAETSLFHEICYRHCLEVATMVYFTRLPAHEGVSVAVKGFN